MPTWAGHVLPHDEPLGLAGNQVDGDLEKWFGARESVLLHM